MQVATEIAQLKLDIDALTEQLNRPQRRLTADQAQKLAESINGEELLAGYYVSVGSTVDTDSSRLCRQLWNIISSTHMTCQMNRQGAHDEGENGIIFYYPDGVEPDPRFEKVAEIFEGIGLSITRSSDKLNPSVCYIFITPDQFRLS